VRVGDRLLIVNGVLMSNMDSYLEARKRLQNRMTLTLQRGNTIHDVEFEFTSTANPATPFATQDDEELPS
jgi:hypothetical protein